MSATNVERALADRLRLVAYLFALAAMSTTAYVVQLAESNASRGFEPLRFDAGYCISVVLSILLLSAVLPTSIRRPSDLFALVYGLFVPLSFAVLHPVPGPTPVVDYAMRFAILVLPLFVTFAAVAPVRGIHVKSVLPARTAEWLVLALCLVGVAAAYYHGPESAGFDIDADERRLEGRDIFAAGSLLAYLIAMVTNGLLPFLSFIGGLRRKWWLGALATGLALVVFYIMGVKAQFIYIAMAYFVGRGLDRANPRFFHRFIFLAILAVFTVFCVERQFHEWTLSGEYIFRRGFAVPADVMSRYFDFIFGNQHSMWSPLYGFTFPDGLTFLIGDLYYGQTTANVNTNAYLLALTAGGIPAYAMTMALTAGVFALLDAGYRGSGNRAYFYIAFAYSILLVEQSATTALLTSGIGLLVLLVGLAAQGWRVPLRREAAAPGA